jgi:predicted nucleic acid-binding protein
MRVLVDTNVLLRIVQSNHPHFAEATAAIATLVRRSDSVFFSPQNIAEFWNVATRPVDRAFQEITGIEKSLSLLPDVPEIYASWKEIVRANKVLGVKVHDARLVAIMTVYSVSGLLTFNAADFARFTNITAIHPSSLVP